jgi:beta-1,4-galactosyltransferase 1
VDYSYTDRPTHLALNVSQFATWSTRTQYGLPYETYFGGVCLFNKSDYIKLNGFSNIYWGWGAEDDDMFYRVGKSELGMIRRNGLFESIPHEVTRPPTNEDYKINFERFKRTAKGLEEDPSGLSDLSYQLVAEKHFENPKYTMFSVDI